MPPDQDPSTARVFQFQSAGDTTLFLDYDADLNLVLKEKAAPADATRQQFRVWMTGQIQNISLQGSDLLNGGYLTRRPDGKGGTIVHLEGFRGGDQNQKWNFKPGARRPDYIGLSDDALYTLIVTPAPPQNQIINAMGDGAAVVVVGFDPKTDRDLVPPDQSWNSFEV